MTPNFTVINKIATAILAERVDPAWTLEDVVAKIPFTFAEKIYEIVGKERVYEADLRKKEEEALAQAVLGSPSLLTGEQLDIS